MSPTPPGGESRFGEIRLQDLVGNSARDRDSLLSAIDSVLREYQVGTHVDDTAMLALQFVGDQLSPPSTPAADRAPSVR